jgi:hypothetical protein
MANRLFISFAIEDAYARDFLRGQARNNGSPFEFVDMSVKQPWDSNWKTQCRTRIRGCHGVIALLSKNSLNAAGQRWEIQCAIDEAIPLLGVYIQKEDTSYPTEMAGKRKIYWSWDGIAGFISGL